MDYKILNSCFSKKAFASFMRGETDFLYNGILCFDNSAYSSEEAYNALFDCLDKHYRNEYFYKTVLFNKLIVLKNKLETTKVMTELNVGKSVADFVTINGRIVIYEIKTEFDSLKRLRNQIEDYYKVTPYVYVVVSENHLKELMTEFRNATFGVFVLTKRGSLKLLREAVPSFSLFDSNSVFDILRKKEYEEVLSFFNKDLPNCSSFLYHSKCQELFGTINNEDLYRMFVKILKRRICVDKEQVLRCPPSLRLMLYPKYNEVQFVRVFGHY